MFQVNFCGYHWKNPDRDVIYRPQGSGDYLFLQITSKMLFYFPEQEKDPVEAEPGACIFFMPGYLQHYQACAVFTNNFVHFSCREEELKGLQIPKNQLFYPGTMPESAGVFRELEEEYLTSRPHREQMQHLLVQQLLLQVDRACRNRLHATAKAELLEQFQKLRLQMLTNCREDWNFGKLNQNLFLGKSQFYAYYRQFFHVSPRRDLLQARINLARNMLTNQALGVSEVSEQCGFHSVYHFIRSFKEVCGCPPGEYARRQSENG